MAVGDAIREATRRQREVNDAVRRAAEQADQEQGQTPGGAPVPRRAQT